MIVFVLLFLITLVGSITGIGIANGSVDKAVISSILMSWLLTLPIAAAISASAYWIYICLLL